MAASGVTTPPVVKAPRRAPAQRRERPATEVDHAVDLADLSAGHTIERDRSGKRRVVEDHVDRARVDSRRRARIGARCADRHILAQAAVEPSASGHGESDLVTHQAAREHDAGHGPTDEREIHRIGGRRVGDVRVVGQDLGIEVDKIDLLFFF